MTPAQQFLKHWETMFPKTNGDYTGHWVTNSKGQKINMEFYLNMFQDFLIGNKKPLAEIYEDQRNKGALYPQPKQSHEQMIEEFDKYIEAKKNEEEEKHLIEYIQKNIEDFSITNNQVQDLLQTLKTNNQLTKSYKGGPNKPLKISQIFEDFLYKSQKDANY